MTHLQLSTLDDLRNVVMIIHQVIKGIDQIKMFLRSDDGNLEPIRWTSSADNELYTCPLPVVTDTIIPIMRIVTGKRFERTSSLRGKTIFEREDYITLRKTGTHN